MSAPAPQAPAPQAPAPQAPVAVGTDPVIMNEGEATYASYKAAKWTDEQIIAAGKGVANYTVA